MSHDRSCDKYDFAEKGVPQGKFNGDGGGEEEVEEDEEDEEEDEDIDNLIEELESQDGDNDYYEYEEAQQSGGARLIPEELLQTDTRIGLTSGDVFIRRKKYGYNQMKGMFAPIAGSWR